MKEDIEKLKKVRDSVKDEKMKEQISKKIELLQNKKEILK